MTPQGDILNVAAPGVLDNDDDPDADSLAVTDADPLSTAGANVTVMADGSFVYDAPGLFWGWDEFGYTADDGQGGEAQATARVFVRPPSIDLAELEAEGTGGFAIHGVDPSDSSGQSVGTAGDVNGDGLADLIVGAFQADPGGDLGAGTSYVVFGKADASAVDLSVLEGAMPAGGFAIHGVDPGDSSGQSVGTAGDVNGDGLADLIIGAHQAAPGGTADAGTSYVVFGKTDAAAVDLGVLEGAMPAGGFAIHGADALDLSGFSVSTAGDVNGDGLADLIVGAYQADPFVDDDAGTSYVVFGKADASAVDLSVLEGIMPAGGFAIYGVDAMDQSGRSVSAAGDVNGDGLSDLIVGAIFAEPGGDFAAGTSYVVFGKADASAVDLSALEGVMPAGGFAIHGVDNLDQSGQSVSTAGDVNGDGLADLIVGARQADPGGDSSAGTSYVVFGKADASAVELSVLEGAMPAGGFAIHGVDVLDQNGHSVSTAGDVDGDGLADLIVGAYFAAPGSNSGAGTSYVVFGKSDAAAVDLSDLEAAMPAGGFAIHGVDALDLSGFSVSTAGDVDGDGLADLLVGAYEADPGGNSEAGTSYVVFGGNFSGSLTCYGSGGDDSLSGSAGIDVVAAGAGDDTIVAGGGADVLRGGAGDDVFELDTVAFAQIDGGTGVDVVRLLGAGLSLDLTMIAAPHFSDIETIDLTGSGDNTLVMEVADLVHASATSNILTVDGDDGDAVTADLSTPGTFAGAVVKAGYTDWTNGTLTLRIADAVDQAGVSP